jgi:hypothetical protein
MLEPSPTDRSNEACPVCGAHRLALVEFPTVSGAANPAASEVFGATTTPDQTPPAIACLACGCDWPDLPAFRLAQSGAAGDHL